MAGRRGGRCGRAAAGQLADLTYDCVTEELLNIARGAAA